MLKFSVCMCYGLLIPVVKRMSVFKIQELVMRFLLPSLILLVRWFIFHLM